MAETNQDAALPPLLTVVEAAGMLGIGRSLAYDLIRRDAWPTAVIRAGRLIRIPSAQMLALLRDGAT